MAYLHILAHNLNFVHSYGCLCAGRDEAVEWAGLFDPQECDVEATRHFKRLYAEKCGLPIEAE